jgi:hypothetical protein
MHPWNAGLVFKAINNDGGVDAIRVQLAAVNLLCKALQLAPRWLS